MGAVLDTKNKVKDKANAVKENIKDMPTQTAYAVYSEMCIRDRHKELARFNPEAPLTMLFDYVKIRFPTLDIQHIIKDILKCNINYMLHEDYGHYSYTEHYSLGDIFIYTSADEEKGVLLELKGRGCRQFESYLLAQQRSWYRCV